MGIGNVGVARVARVAPFNLFTSIVVQDLIGPVVAVRLGNALGLGHRLRAGRRATCHSNAWNSDDFLGPRHSPLK